MLFKKITTSIKGRNKKATSKMLLVAVPVTFKSLKKYYQSDFVFSAAVI